MDIFEFDLMIFLLSANIASLSLLWKAGGEFLLKPEISLKDGR